MSDTWYRDPIPPYEDWEGGLWTVDGTCLNPVHGCEEPAWVAEMAAVNLQAEFAMSLREWWATDVQPADVRRLMGWESR